MPMFLILQMLAFLSIYEISMPANADIFVGEFRSMVKFEILKPDNLLNLVQPGLTVAILMGDVKGSLKGTMDRSDIKSPSLLVNMAVYVAAFLLFVLVLVLLYVIAKFKKFKTKLKAKLKDIQSKTFWNNTIQSLSLSYLETCIVLVVKIKYIKLLKVVPISEYITIVIMFLFLLGNPILCMYQMFKYRN